jgi:arginyl-tRNA synthetase
MDFKQEVIGQLAALTGLEQEVIAGAVEVPPEQKLGDLAFPCFVLAKTMRKAPPVIAQELAGKYPAGQTIERVEAVGGYLNFFYNRGAFAQETLSVLRSAGSDWGKSEAGKGKKVIVEFSSPNIAKPFHIGHLFSTAVGNSLARIYDQLGYDVVRINHLGDWGTQFGKLISAYKRWGDRSVIEKDPINELLKIYVKFHEEAEKHPELDDEAREYFRRLEEGDKETTELWQYFRDVSLVEFKRVYELLGVHFDSYAGESFYGDKMQEVVELLEQKDLLTDSEGAKVVDLSELDVPPCIILKSDGATIYATRDIAAALYRKRTYDFEKNIYVVGSPQALHFKQIFAVIDKMGYEWAKDCVHVGFGLVKFPDKKLSTRNGDVVFLEDVLQEAVTKTREVIEANSPELKNKEEVSKKIGIGAILYTFLKNNREKDIVFSWDSMLDFDGESAPYCQYGYARGKSILRRAEVDYQDADYSKLCGDDEYMLIKQLGAFGDAVQAAADKNEPFYINRYVTNLTRAFNKFYNSNPILRSDVDAGTQKARLALVEAATTVIRSALGLLGIETVESM